MSAIDMLQRAIYRYKISNLTPIAIVAVSESFMLRLYAEVKEHWSELAEPGSPFPPIEAFMAGEVELFGVRLVHQVRVCSIV